jgi:glucose-6-phosphate-specific signal transduction histidine kinase
VNDTVITFYNTLFLSRFTTKKKLQRKILIIKYALLWNVISKRSCLHSDNDNENDNLYSSAMKATLALRVNVALLFTALYTASFSTTSLDYFAPIISTRSDKIPANRKL